MMTAALAHNYPLELLIDAHAQLAFKLRQLEPRVWRLRSRSAPWRNSRVLAHLVASADLYRRSIVRALDGDAEFSDAAVYSVACYEVCQERLSELPASVVLDAFDRTGKLLNAEFWSLSADDFARPAWHPHRQVTIKTLLALRIVELGLHGWHILASVGTLADACPTTTLKCPIDPMCPASPTSGGC
jgi:hypothetical protein